jgi:hypothetical protein
LRRNGKRWTLFALSAALLAVAVAAAGSARAALDVARFTVTPSTTQAGAHPNLSVSVAFAGPSTGLKDIAFHLPAGLTATRRAAPFCSHRRLVSDLCPRRSAVGSISVLGVAFGFELTVSKRIYNLRPAGSERVRLGVPIYGTVSRPGIAAELPITERADKGLDMSVTGLPSDVNGIAIQIERIDFRFRGIVRSRVGRRVRKKAFLTNPLRCAPPTSTLEVTSHDAPTAKIVRTSEFTPTGCGHP